MSKTEIIHQTKNAFDFLQKLYFETSYLVKEIEGILAEEEEKFVIGRGGGYAVSARSSNGLEAVNVPYWPLRMFSVYFLQEGYTKKKGATTVTDFVSGLKVIHLRITLDDKEISEQYIRLSVLYDIARLSKRDYPTKFEQVSSIIEYTYSKVFTKDDSIDYQDSYCKFKGKCFKVNLFDINSSEEIRKLVTEPILKIYREL